MKKLILLIIITSFLLISSCKKKSNPTEPLDSLPTQGLVAYYPFNGNANDESGNGNNGINHGAIFTNGVCIISGNSGELGSDKYVEIPNFIDGLTQLAISIRVKEYNLSFWHGESYISFGSAFADGIGFVSIGHYDYNGTSTLHFYTSTKTSATPLVISWQDSYSNDFQNYIFIIDGVNDLEKAYMNGSLIESKVISKGPIYTIVNHAAIGKHWFTGASSTRFNGEIDNVRIYNRVLTDSEIQLLYHEGGWK